MAALIARNQSRASIQAIIDYVEDADFQNRNYVQLHNRFDYLLEQWTTFKENSNLVRVQANDDDEEERHVMQSFLRKWNRYIWKQKVFWKCE